MFIYRTKTYINQFIILNQRERFDIIMRHSIHKTKHLQSAINEIQQYFNTNKQLLKQIEIQGFYSRFQDLSLTLKNILPEQNQGQKRHSSSIIPSLEEQEHEKQKQPISDLQCRSISKKILDMDMMQTTIGDIYTSLSAARGLIQQKQQDLIQLSSLPQKLHSLLPFLCIFCDPINSQILCSYQKITIKISKNFSQKLKLLTQLLGKLTSLKGMVSWIVHGNTAQMHHAALYQKLFVFRYFQLDYGQQWRCNQSFVQEIIKQFHKCNWDKQNFTSWIIYFMQQEVNQSDIVSKFEKIKDKQFTISKDDFYKDKQQQFERQYIQENHDLAEEQQIIIVEANWQANFD